MMMRTPNFDHYTNCVAREHERKNNKRAKALAKSILPTAKAPDIQKQDPASVTPPIPSKPDYLNALVGHIEKNGAVTMFPDELSALLGLTKPQDQAVLLGVLAALNLHAHGIRYFPLTTKGSYGQIAFRMLSLDKS